MQALTIWPDAARRLEFTPNHPRPVARPGEVTIRVTLAGICATDLEIVGGYMQFAGVPGHEFVGTVMAGSEELTGKRVVAEINCPCGACDLCRRGLGNHCPQRTVLGIQGRDGAFAEYLTIPASNCHIVPDNVSDQQAVFVEPLAAAAHVLDAWPIESGQRVAVLGSGRLGLLVAQVLALEECELDIIGRNEKTLALCARRGLRAFHVKRIREPGAYDAVVDCTGTPDGLRLALQWCRPCGTVVLKSTYAEPAAIDLAPIVIHEVSVVGNRCGPFPPALKLLSEGRIEVDELVSAVYPLHQGVDALDTAARPDSIKVLLEPGTS